MQSTRHCLDYCKLLVQHQINHIRRKEIEVEVFMSPNPHMSCPNVLLALLHRLCRRDVLLFCSHGSAISELGSTYRVGMCFFLELPQEAKRKKSHICSGN